MHTDHTHIERALFRRIAEGDEDAFREFYQLVQPSLLVFVGNILRSDADVQEVMQEVLVRLWVSRDKLREVDQPRSWFFRIVSNECFRYLKKKGVQERVQRVLVASGTEHSALTTELDMSFRETQRILQKAIRELAPRQREIYILSRDKGLKVAEIAERIGVTPKYIEKTLTTALQALREKLIQAGRWVLLLLFWWIR